MSSGVELASTWPQGQQMGKPLAVASTHIVKQSEGSLGRDAGLFKSATGKVLVLNRRLISTDTTVFTWSHLAPGVPNRYCLGMQPLGTACPRFIPSDRHTAGTLKQKQASLPGH